MHGLSGVDEGREIDWGKTSRDYAKYRPGPPNSFYSKLKSLDVGTGTQSILDLGTGTGVLARSLAQNFNDVSATDISKEQITMASALAKEEGLNINFQVAAAESQPFKDESFDVITANQCWLYFDKSKIIPEVFRLLRPNGLLVTSHFSWLPRRCKIAKASEDLILKHNPVWSAANYTGDIPAFPSWAEGKFKLKAMFYYDEEIAFTKESWRGRIRACRGVAATLSESEVLNFDKEHEELLNNIAGDDFTITHRIDAHIFEPIRSL